MRKNKGYVYLTQENKQLGTDRYKIGVSHKKEPRVKMSRLKSYGKESEPEAIIFFPDPKVVEKELKEAFQSKYETPFSNKKCETFIGDIGDMKKTFLRVCLEHQETTIYAEPEPIAASLNDDVEDPVSAIAALYPSDDEDVETTDSMNEDRKTHDQHTVIEARNHEGHEAKWLPGFKAWMPDNGGQRGGKASPINCSRCLRVINKLTLGEGIQHRNHCDRPYFKKGVSLVPSNVHAWIKDAKRFEETYGTDKGNGWALSTPLNKVAAYAKHLETIANTSASNP